MSAQSQPQLERARCQHDGYLIGPDGKCWFCGEKFAERIPLHLVSTHSQPKVEVEMSVSEQQLLLSEELFERYEVPSVKVTVSGTIEVPLEMLEQMSAEGFEPGDVVAATIRGHVLDVSAPYDPAKNDHKGRLVLRAELLSGVQRLVVSRE